MPADTPPPHEGVRLLETKVISDSFGQVRRHQLQFKKFDGRWSPEIGRDVYVTGNAAIVLPYDPIADTVLLVKQFRMGPWSNGDEPWIYECVAGRIEPGHTAKETAYKEFREEAGLDLKDLIEIPGFYTTPGTMEEYMHAYCAHADLPPQGGIHGVANEQEDIQTLILSATEAIDWAFTGRVKAGPTALCLYWFAVKREGIRRQWSEIT